MLFSSLGTAVSGIEKKSRHMCCMILEDFGVKNFGVVSFKLRKIQKRPTPTQIGTQHQNKVQPREGLLTWRNSMDCKVFPAD